MTTVPSGQRKRSVTQVLASPNGLVADIAALLLIPAYVVVIMLLYVNEHDNVRTIFTALSPLVATAVGWVFGREVHRKQAENATAFAQNATEEAMKGHRLAGAVKTAVDMANSNPGKSVDLAALSNLATTLFPEPTPAPPQ